MRYFLKLSLLGLVMLLGACAGPDMYDASYVSSMPMPVDNNAYLLEDGARPMVIMTPDLEKDLETFTNQNYAVVGESRFNGPEGGVDDAISLAKKLGVTHVLLNAQYAYDASKKAYKFIENFDYIPYDSGYIVGYGGVRRQILYERIANPISIPYKKNVSIYNHRAIFLVKMKE